MSFTFNLSKKTLAELRRSIDLKDHQSLLTEGLSSMFVRRGLPEDYFGKEQLIEETLLEDSCGGYLLDSKKSSKWVFGTCQLGGEPDAWGFGTKAIVTLRNGAVYEFEDYENNPDVVVVFNTPTRLRDKSIPLFSDFLMEIDCSLRSQLKNSRMHPTPVVNDEKSRAAVQEALDAMDRGELRTIISSNILRDLLELGVDGKVFDVLNITDPSASDHIQYIAKFRDDIMRWFWNYYGHNPESSGKMAQQSVAEVTTGASISMILPHTRYHARQMEAELLKKKFGWDVSIEFSEPWQNAFAKCDAEQNPEKTPEEGANNDDSCEDISVQADKADNGADEV